MSPDYAQAFDAGQRQAFMDRIAGTRQPRPARLQCEADRGWWDGYTPRNAAWWVAQPDVNREHVFPLRSIDPAPAPLQRRECAERAAKLRRLNPPDQRHIQRLLVAERDRCAA